MKTDFLGRYATRMKQLAAGLHSINVDIPYQTGRKLRTAGLHWSMAGRFTYQGQRFARLGYCDKARRLPDRPTAEGWPSKD